MKQLCYDKDEETICCPLCVLGNQLEATLCLCWPEPLVTARAGHEGFPPEELPPLSRQQAELAMEILKILFNITFNTNRRKVDEVRRNISCEVSICC